MHYTEASGNVVETIDGTSRTLHIDQSLPTVQGTTGSAEYFNALGMEIINVIERAGLTVEVNAATDRSNYWTQLETAIFDQAAIDTSALADGAVTNAKIDGMSLTKLNAGVCNIDVVDGDYTRTLFMRNYTSDTSLYIQVLRTTGSPVYDIKSYLSENEIIFTYDVDSVETESASLKYDGLFFKDSIKRIKHMALSFDSASWTSYGGGWRATVATGLATATYPLVAHFRYREISTGLVSVMGGHASGETSTNPRIWFEPNGGDWDAVIVSPINIGGGGYNNRYMTFFYSNA